MRRAPLALLLLLAGCSMQDRSVPGPAAPANAADAAPPACPPGGLGCVCDAAGRCATDGVCDAVTGRCRAALPCACVAHQRCRTAPGRDAVCVDACEPGFDWDPEAGRCVADLCHPAQGSLAADCEAAHRRCDRRGHCGDCLPGHRAEDGACVPVADCAELDCGAEGRTCVEENGTARCGPCLDGYFAFGAECRPDRCGDELPGGTAARCTEGRRTCVDGPGGPRCGDCWAGNRDDGSGRCVRLLDCTALGCDDQGRVCLPADPVARTDAACGDCRPDHDEQADGTCARSPSVECGDPADEDSIAARCAAANRLCAEGACLDHCVAGHRYDAARDACVPEPTCDECIASGRPCIEDGGVRCGDECLEGHRFDPATGACVADCPAGQGRDPRSGACVPTCEHDGDCGLTQRCQPLAGSPIRTCIEDCEPGTRFNGVQCIACPPCDAPGERGREHTVITADGLCLCETADGYFYSTANEIGPRPCDADGDGWVRDSARPFLTAADPAVRAQARCHVVEIRSVELRNEVDPEPHRVLVSPPVQLFESDRNDDDALLQRHFERLGLPRDYIGPDGGWSAAHLNRLTKLCHAPTMDYNDNGVPDVQDFAQQGPHPNAPRSQATFDRFAHFAELHRVHIDAERAVMVIEERPRAELPLAYDGPRDEWRTCLLRRDSRWDPRTPNTGLDFAEFDPTGQWSGMLYHSLFKCLTLRNVADPLHYHEVAVDAARDTFALNRCHGAAGGSVSCEVLGPATPVAAGDVLWGLARYQHGPSDEIQFAHHYRFGCVDECAEWRSEQLPETRQPDGGCPRWPNGIPACRDDVDAFGRVRCQDVPCDGNDNDGDGQVDEGLDIVGDGVDNDRDGSIDEGTCETPLSGVCGEGEWQCVLDEGREWGLPTCVPKVSVGQRSETCNGEDDDCDGTVDECNDDGNCVDGVLTVACGSARGACSQGVQRCVDGAFSEVCEGEVMAQEEICNAVDDDCDGFTDEGNNGQPVAGLGNGAWVTAGADCDAVDAEGVCNEGTWECAPDGRDDPNPMKCDPRQPDGPERCDNLDNDCDGRTDEGSSCGDFIEENCHLYLAWSDNNWIRSSGSVDLEKWGSARPGEDGEVVLEGCFVNPDVTYFDPDNIHHFAREHFCTRTGLNPVDLDNRIVLADRNVGFATVLMRSFYTGREADIDVDDNDDIGIAFRCEDTDDEYDTDGQYGGATARLGEFIQEHCVLFIGWTDLDLTPDEGEDAPTVGNSSLLWDGCPHNDEDNGGAVRCTSTHGDGAFHNLDLRGDLDHRERFAAMWRCQAAAASASFAERLEEASTVYFGWHDVLEPDEFPDWSRCLGQDRYTFFRRAGARENTDGACISADGEDDNDGMDKFSIFMVPEGDDVDENDAFALGLFGEPIIRAGSCDEDGDGHRATRCEDGIPPGGDCNDLDPDVHSGAAEIRGDRVDQDCDGNVDEG